MMKQLLTIISALIVLMTGMTNVYAGPWWRNRDDGGGQRERQQPQRQDRVDSSQYQYQQNGRAPERDQDARYHRMTPEERRVLRQQIQDAGREVYPPHR